MTPWHHGWLAALDCETTGVDVETARIVSGTVAIVGAGKPTELVEVLADPGVEIPQEAIDRHLDRFRPAKVASHGLEDVCRLYGAMEPPERLNLQRGPRP